jgi:hypothetical protein
LEVEFWKQVHTKKGEHEAIDRLVEELGKHPGKCDTPEFIYQMNYLFACEFRDPDLIDTVVEIVRLLDPSS